MFTGIIEGQGKVVDIIPNSRQNTTQLVLNLTGYTKDLEIGQSVAINGVCLTVIEVMNNICKFEMMHETKKTTSLNFLQKDSLVNIERSIRADQRIEGHFVLGHVDGVATITKIEDNPQEVKFWLEIPQDLVRFVVKKGSIAIDGISLTVVDAEQSLVSVCIIPHTLQMTNLATKKVGQQVNVETDILGKYVLK